MVSNDPKTVTFYGRLSYPVWTAQEAFARSQKGSYPAKDVDSVSPDFQLIVTQGQFDKVLKHCVEVFLPYCQEQHAKGEKKDALEPAEVQKLIESVTGDLSAQVYNSPFKVVYEKTADLAPEGVASVKVIGPKGGDFVLKAIVRDESELAIPDPDILQFPVIKPLHETTHQMYPGCEVAVTVNLYAYRNGKLPGFSAGGNVAVFRGDADRFGGGVEMDSEAMFLD